MISRPFVALAHLVAIVTATSIPICVKDSSVTTPSTIASLSNYTTQFCTQIASSNFTSSANNSNMDYALISTISLDFTSTTTKCSGDNNSAANCENVYSILLSGCGNNNSTITGSGSIDTDCGIYAFQLINTNTNKTNANATTPLSKSGSGKTSGVSYCMVTGSVLCGVAALFGWFL
ncbi:hypothetical protein SBOR_1692 [Sclerotinia borealis F-4128]|uniref:Uncharacterized protein n=1 Tax=Sclerotinia borealis (strain F-4128) TaxID=1432307 RepID=W9CMB7_SCLBF|nr:hypothetical protein SBOR_1692 [Sclerotinia borealis F-4128]